VPSAFHWRRPRPPGFHSCFCPEAVSDSLRDTRLRFSISGARQTFEEAKRTYRLAGADEKMSMADADDGHGYSKTKADGSLPVVPDAGSKARRITSPSRRWRLRLPASYAPKRASLRRRSAAWSIQ
jgi:hypothetical protein